MGLISVGLSSLSSTMRDQWKEFFVCEGMPDDVLVTRGQKRTNTGFNKGNDNVITNGSGVIVADGQCMIIVEQGKVVDICAEPGEFTYNNEIAPSVFTGKLGDAIKDSFARFAKTFTYGGETGIDQRVYYFNTKELLDNKFGTPNPIPFRAVDAKIGLDLDVQLRCSGVYTYRIADPLLFYTNVSSMVEYDYTRDMIEGTMKGEFISALQPAIGRLADLEMRPNEIVKHTGELEAYLNEELSAKWRNFRGIEVVNVAISSVTLTEQDLNYIQQLQRAAAAANPYLGAGFTNVGTIDAINTAAANPNGGVAGIMGVGMVGGNTGNIAGMYANAQQSGVTAPGAPAPAPAPAANTWTCPVCGAVCDGNFCPKCGAKRPEKATWFCPTCGAENDGNFCPKCGTKKPE